MNTTIEQYAITERVLTMLKGKLADSKIDAIDFLQDIPLSELQLKNKLNKLSISNEDADLIINTIIEENNKPLAPVIQVDSNGKKDYSSLNDTIKQYEVPEEGWNILTITDINISTKFENPQYEFIMKFEGLNCESKYWTGMSITNKESKLKKLISAIFTPEEKIDFNKIVGQELEGFIVYNEENGEVKGFKIEKFRKKVKTS